MTVKVDHEPRYTAFMDNNDNDTLSHLTTVAYLAPSKESFKAMVASMTASLARIDEVYPPIVEQLSAFDKELAARVSACAAADRELLTYLRSKAESGDRRMPALATLLLLGR